MSTKPWVESFLSSLTSSPSGCPPAHFKHSGFSLISSSIHVLSCHRSLHMLLFLPESGIFFISSFCLVYYQFIRYFHRHVCIVSRRNFFFTIKAKTPPRPKQTHKKNHTQQNTSQQQHLKFSWPFCFIFFNYNIADTMNYIKYHVSFLPPASWVSTCITDLGSRSKLTRFKFWFLYSPTVWFLLPFLWFYSLIYKIEITTTIIIIIILILKGLMWEVNELTCPKHLECCLLPNKHSIKFGYYYYYFPSYHSLNRQGALHENDFWVLLIMDSWLKAPLYFACNNRYHIWRIVLITQIQILKKHNSFPIVMIDILY